MQPKGISNEIECEASSLDDVWRRDEDDVKDKSYWATGDKKQKEVSWKKNERMGNTNVKVRGGEKHNIDD